MAFLWQVMKSHLVMELEEPLKWLAARVSLQATENNQILSHNQTFQCATQNIVGIIFLYMSDEEVTSNIKAYELEQRYSRCSTVSGTRSHHCFIPQSKSTLSMKRLSSDEEGAKVKLYNDDNVTSIRSHEQLHQNLHPGKYVACLYHWVWYIDAVIERLDQNKDAYLYIKFMKQNHLVSTLPQELQNEC